MLTHSLKRLAARIGIVALLFSQYAVAAYGCPLIMAPDETAHAAIADDTHAGMPDCHESDDGKYSLCIQHCIAASQSSVQSTPQGSPVPAAVMLPFFVAAPKQPACDIDSPVLTALLERQTSPPPLLRFCVLRI